MNHIDVHVYRQMICLVGLANNSAVEVCFLCNTFCGLFPVTLFNASFFVQAFLTQTKIEIFVFWLNLCSLSIKIFTILCVSFNVYFYGARKLRKNSPQTDYTQYLSALSHLKRASLLVNGDQFSSFAVSSSFHCLASLSLVFDFLNSLISFPILCNSIRRIIAELCSLIIYSLLCLYRTWTEQLKWKCVSLENSWSCLQTLYADNVQGHWKWDKNLYCHTPMTVIWKVYSLANKDSYGNILSLLQPHWYKWT